MKNREKYKDMIMSGKFGCKYVREIIFKDEDGCYSVDGCTACRLKQMLWLDEEAEEETIDWSKVEVDTPILVSDGGKKWHNRYFAKFEDGKVYAFYDGKTSWTAHEYKDWKYAKLYETES